MRVFQTLLQLTVDVVGTLASAKHVYFDGLVRLQKFSSGDRVVHPWFPNKLVVGVPLFRDGSCGLKTVFSFGLICVAYHTCPSEDIAHAPSVGLLLRCVGTLKDRIRMWMLNW